MRIDPGSRVGSYEVLAPLGVGGWEWCIARVIDGSIG